MCKGKGVWEVRMDRNKICAMLKWEQLKVFNVVDGWGDAVGFEF